MQSEDQVLTQESKTFRKKLKLKKHKMQKRTKHTESDSDCFGDSEQSESEDDSVNDKATSPEKITRKEFAKTRQTLAEEQLVNNNKGELVCLTCLRRFSNIQNLRRHLRLHLSRDSNIPDFESDSENCDNNNKRYNCDFCPEKFDNKCGFLVHEKTHAGQALECYVCAKTYSDRYSLRYHLRTHGIGEQIRCELCGKHFTKQSRLQSHIDLFHKDIRKFECSQCDKTFKTKIHLENHLLQHSGERPYKCETCGDRFRHKLSLVTHMRVHKDSRPFVCDICGKAFRDSSTMKAHKRVHTGDKPYKCNLCDKSFTQRAGLNYHKNVHAGSKPHKCQDCDYATAKKSSLKSHIETMHKKKSEVAATDSVPSRIKTVEIKCVENTNSVDTPPLPSPPSLQGDAVFTSTKDSTISLPSFNILKSYDSPCISPCSESGGSSQDRHSSYDPSLSPPLSPPGQDYQDLSQPFSSQPPFTNSYSVTTGRNGNQDFSHHEHDHHHHHLQYHHQEQDHHMQPPYCPPDHVHDRKSFFDYQNHYGIHYNVMHYYHQKGLVGYSLNKEHGEDKWK